MKNKSLKRMGNKSLKKRNKKLRKTGKNKIKYGVGEQNKPQNPEQKSSSSFFNMFNPFTRKTPTNTVEKPKSSFFGSLFSSKPLEEPAPINNKKPPTITQPQNVKSTTATTSTVNPNPPMVKS